MLKERFPYGIERRNSRDIWDPPFFQFGDDTGGDGYNAAGLPGLQVLQMVLRAFLRKVHVVHSQTGSASVTSRIWTAPDRLPQLRVLLVSMERRRISQPDKAVLKSPAAWCCLISEYAPMIQLAQPRNHIIVDIRPGKKMLSYVCWLSVAAPPRFRRYHKSSIHLGYTKIPDRSALLFPLNLL